MDNSVTEKINIQPEGNNSEAALSLPVNKMLKGCITDIGQYTITIKPDSLDPVVLKIEIPPDAKIGDDILFRIIKGSDGYIADILPKKESDIKLNVLTNALISAGLKLNENNLNIAALLMDNNLPLNKESIMALKRGSSLVGFENIEKPLYLMNNSVAVNSQNINILTEIGEGQRILTNQLQSLINSVLENPDAQLKNNLLQTFFPSSSPSPSSSPIDEKVIEEAAKSKSITAFQKEVFLNTNLKDLSANSQKFWTQENKEAFANEILPALKKGVLTEEMVINAIKNLPEGEKFLNANNNIKEELKLYVLNSLGTMKEEFEAISNGVKESIKQNKAITSKIINNLLLRPDKEDFEQFRSYFQSINEKLVTAYETIKENAGSEEIKKNLDSVRQTVMFMNDLKGNYFQMPLLLNNGQPKTELFVFSQKSSKKILKKSNSALLALDTLNLGHLETYVVKDEKQVTCNFKVERPEIKSKISGEISRLRELLNKQGYTLSAFEFTLGDGDSFKITDDEPFKSNEDKGLKRFQIDVRT